MVVLLVLVVGLGLPHLKSYKNRQASIYAALGGKAATLQLALKDYRIAEALDPGDTNYGAQVAVAQSKVYLEEGSDSSAITAVQGVSTSNARLQLAMSYMVAGQAASARKLSGGVGESQPQLAGVLAGGLGLAQELYAQGLYRSTQRVLATTSDSPGKYLLLAHALLAQSSNHNQVLTAQTATQKGITLDPASLPLHQLLESIDTKLGDHAGAGQEQQLINQLQAGNV
ncbi:MAG TPA: hypothetical protein VMR75_03560 [Candidatus Saccharimonadales bacterium]|nr:hypothetical protein [Candidatus Saccharimonadales bacterium]